MVGAYAITAIRWNDEHTEVDSCLVHELETEGRRLALQDGVPMWYTDVVSLIKNGNTVLVMGRDTDGEYQPGAVVGVRMGNDEYLQSSPEDALFDLPGF